MHNYIIQVESDIIAGLRHLYRRTLAKHPIVKTYVQGYLDVPCYREVVLNDEGYEMNLGRWVLRQTGRTLTLYCSG